MCIVIVLIRLTAKHAKYTKTENGRKDRSAEILFNVLSRYFAFKFLNRFFAFAVHFTLQIFKPVYEYRHHRD
jgi:hypothetical protein